MIVFEIFTNNLRVLLIIFEIFMIIFEIFIITFDIVMISFEIFTNNLFVFQYYCEHCWATIHSRPGREFHKPLVKEGADRPRAVPFRWC